MNEEIKKLNDQISRIEQEFRASSNERKSQINQINLQIRQREDELLEQGLTYTDLAMDEKLQSLTSKIEDINKAEKAAEAETLKEIEKISPKLEKMNDLIKKIDARTAELEAQGADYNDMYLDQTIKDLRDEFDKIANEEQEKAKAEEKQNEAKRQEYKDLQKRKAELEEKIASSQRNKLFDERDQRMVAINALASKGKKIDDPEYKEYMLDIQRINKELEKVDKEIAESKEELEEVKASIEKMEAEYGKEFFEEKQEVVKEEKTSANKTEEIKEKADAKQEQPAQKQTPTKETTVKQENFETQVIPPQGEFETVIPKANRNVTKYQIPQYAESKRPIKNDTIPYMTLKEKLELTNLSLDVSRGTANVSFNMGINKEIDLSPVLKKIKPSEERKFFNEIGVRCTKTMDPYMITAISKAVTEILSENGIDSERAQNTLINKFAKNYEKSINDFAEEKNSYNPVKVTYMKLFGENMDKKHIKFEKALRPFIKYANLSEHVSVAENIDTRNWLEKLTDKVRSVFNPKKAMPEFVEKSLSEKVEDIDTKSEGSKADAYRENLRKGVDIKQPTASKEQEVKEKRKIEENEKNVTSGKVNEPDKDDAER
jgi:hypothetical protein